MSEESKNEYRRVVERKKVGDELDRLAVEIVTRDSVKYPQAFRRISVLHPELVKQYLA